MYIYSVGDHTSCLLLIPNNYQSVINNKTVPSHLFSAAWNADRLHRHCVGMYGKEKFGTCVESLNGYERASNTQTVYTSFCTDTL